MTDNESEVQALIIPDRRAANPYRRPFLILVIALCLSLLAQAFTSYQTWFVASDTNKIVSDIEFKNSAENRKAEQKSVETIILRVDCNARKAIEEALNEISAENPGVDFNIDITSERCGDTSTEDPEG